MKEMVDEAQNILIKDNQLSDFGRLLHEQHFTTFTLPRKLMKLVYTRPELSPLDFLRFGP